MNRGHFTSYAQQRIDDARRDLAAHRTVRYTGVCRQCGRPGPCDEQRAARQRLVYYTTRLPDETVDELRTAWLALIAANDRAGAYLHGASRWPGRRLPWQDAVTECWRALGAVHAGLAEARADPATPGGPTSVLAGLGLARADADRAAALAARVRRRLGAAEDLLRRTGRTDALIAARRFAAAGRRLDLVAARLAVGARHIDRYTAGLAGTPEPARPVPRVAPALPEEIAAGVRAATRLVRARRRRERPGWWRRTIAMEERS
ncbi:hypothetical protein [Micromonospora cathayae]|uniref:CHAD domain-containing protein n=1 Tax=Micromonospora cathayae TaxID=3028804 RepID=A0ABY7ZMN9_9ACTN|nr:hypothetical protein [Micromonospora sp. HUAS 3]WDZ84292.1 hypothetical protein PVK37_28180 [Micromonospora sp. HUAS 3]